MSGGSRSLKVMNTRMRHRKVRDARGVSERGDDGEMMVRQHIYIRF